MFTETVYKGFSVWAFSGEPKSYSWKHVQNVGVLAEGLQVATEQVRRQKALVAVIVDSSGPSPNIQAGVYWTGSGTRGVRFKRIAVWNPDLSPNHVTRSVQHLFTDPTDEEVDYRGRVEMTNFLRTPGQYFGQELQRQKGSRTPEDGYWALVLTEKGWRVFEQYGKISQYHTPQGAMAAAQSILQSGWSKPDNELTYYDRIDRRDTQVRPYPSSVAVSCQDGTVRVLNVYYHAAHMGSFFTTHHLAVPHSYMDDQTLQGLGWSAERGVAQRNDLYDTHVPDHRRPQNGVPHDPRRMSQDELVTHIYWPIHIAIDNGTVAHYKAQHPDLGSDTDTGLNMQI